MLCMKFSWNPNTSFQRFLDPLSQCILFRWASYSGISQQPIRINKLVNIVEYHPTPSRLVSRTHPLFFYALLGALCLSIIPVEFFSDLYSPPCGKNFEIFCVHIPRKCMESRPFYSCSLFPVKSRPRVLIITP